MTRGERLQIAGFATAVLAIVGGITWYHVVQVGRYDLDSNMSYLLTAYHLDQSQAQQVRELETEFHSRDKRFGFLVPGNGASDEHHRAISHLMNPEDGIRFLKNEAGQVR